MLFALPPMFLSVSCSLSNLLSILIHSNPVDMESEASLVIVVEGYLCENVMEGRMGEKTRKIYESENNF